MTLLDSIKFWVGREIAQFLIALGIIAVMVLVALGISLYSAIKTKINRRRTQ